MTLWLIGATVDAARNGVLAHQQNAVPAITLLQSAPRIIDLKRKKALIDTLRERGHILIETALPERPMPAGTGS